MGAAALLEQYRVPLVVDRAIYELEYIHSRINFKHLYRHFFPEAFANSKASNEIAKNMVYSPKECEFFELVSNFLFELPGDSGYVDERDDQILIMSQGIDPDYDLFEQQRPGLQILSILYTQTIPIPISQQMNLPEKVERYLNRCVRAGSLSFQRLGDKCKEFLFLAPFIGGKEDKPLAYFAETIEIIDHSTGNIYLDVLPDDCQTFSWSIDNIEYLTREFKEAQEALDRVTELLNWIEKDDFKTLTNLRKLVKVWNSAID